MQRSNAIEEVKDDIVQLKGDVATLKQYHEDEDYGDEEKGDERNDAEEKPTNSEAET